MSTWKERAAKNRARAMQMPRVPCQCGCGEMILALTADGEPRQYADGHMLSAVRAARLREQGGLPKGLEMPVFSQQPACAASWVDPEWFYADTNTPEGREDRKRAREVCSGCPVRDQCMEFAFEHGERFGIWGGLSVQQRGQMKARRQAANAA